MSFQLSEEDLEGNVSWHYEYDQSGKLLAARCSNGESFVYEYNTTTGELTGQTFYNSANPSGIHDAYTYANYSGSGERILSQISRDGGNATVSYTYDGFYRATKTAKLNAGASVTSSYTFRPGTASNSTSVIPSALTQTVKNNDGNTVSEITYVYTYDSRGNIKTISEGSTLKVTYTYDGLNQLEREDNAYLNKTITYQYDLGGNLTSVKEYACLAGLPLPATPNATYSYTYGDNNWKDKLTAYNGNTITYDAIGNPLSYYNGYSFTWTQGRRLASASNGTNTISYAYNSNGIRIKKTVNNIVTNYTLDGTKVIQETTGSDTIWYYYDESGTPVAFNLNSDLYLYTKNLQGDITGIVGTDGAAHVSYVYDAWGKVTASVVGNSTVGASLIAKNPYLYRGYRYDAETGLYYLNSRYYDPQTGRFINADIIICVQKGLKGNNLFEYAYNNPSNMMDDDGLDAIYISDRTKNTGLKILGHARLFIQDSNGNWYFTEVAGEGYNKKTAHVVFYEVVPQSDTYKLLQAVLNKEIIKDIDYVYIEGDFSEGVKYGEEKSKEDYDYSFLFNNCLHYVKRVLRKGIYRNTSLQSFVERSFEIIPDVFCQRLTNELHIGMKLYPHRRLIR